MILLVAPAASVGTCVDVRRERKGMKRNSNSHRLALIRWVILATVSEVMARAKIGGLGLQASCLLLSVVRDILKKPVSPTLPRVEGSRASWRQSQDLLLSKLYTPGRL